jgi:hypothetical protein
MSKLHIALSSLVRSLYLQNNQTKTPHITGALSNFLKSFSWCSIKNDYRTLVGLEDVNVVETYADIDEDEDDE